MGSMSRRLAHLEERLQAQHEPDEGHLVDKAAKRLSKVELAVLSEVLEIKAAHPDLNDAETWRLMTDTQREMEVQWRRVVREVRSELEAPA